MDAKLQKFLQPFQHLKIQLKEIQKATNNFNDNCIGVGGFGNVYKGELSHSEGRSMVAIKRLDSAGRQGTPEFLKEITVLHDYRHENLISLLGFCCEDGEMILVYELASHGSLDRYLKSPHLTWRQRLKICLDAAKGLSYLHDPRETHRRLIHCDIKSANILLDDQWNAKVSDLGLSIMGSANEEHSVIVTLAAGTHGYCDPVYAMTHTLTKESDVYSLGVVLFEVLCGTLCCTYSNGRVQQNLVKTWIKSYEEKKLNDIIFKDPNIQPLEHSALEIFSDIAYRCLTESREDRPVMADVVTELVSAIVSQEYLEAQELLESQEFKSEWNKQRSYYEKISKTAEPPLNYRSEVQLKLLMSKGVLLNGGKTWFSLNKKGEHCEMISIAECLGSKCKNTSSPNNISRFPSGTYCSDTGKFKTHVKAEFLSPGITYTVNLVFKCQEIDGGVVYYTGLKYKLQEETKTSISHLAFQRKDGWWVCELYQFTSDQRTVDLEILFDGFGQGITIEAEGIEFWPLEKLEHKDEKLSISDSDVNWEEKLPTDYEEIMKRSENSVQWTTKEEAYSIIRKGFLISDDKNRGIEHKYEKQPIPYSDANWEEQFPTEYEYIRKTIEKWTTEEEDDKERRTVEHKYEKQPIPDSDANWAELFMTEHEDIVKTIENWTTEEDDDKERRIVEHKDSNAASVENWLNDFQDAATCYRNNMLWTMKKEGVFMKRSIWFFLDKNGKKCHMLSARAAAIRCNQESWLSIPESRFGEAFQCHSWFIHIDCEIQSQLVSPETTYLLYLVYKLPKDHCIFEIPLQMELDSFHVSGITRALFLVCPQTPVIGLKANQNTNSLVKLNGVGLPQQRNDGWMEVYIGGFQTPTTIETIDMRLQLSSCDWKKLSGLIVEGFEFRPL